MAQLVQDTVALIALILFGATAAFWVDVLRALI